MMQGDDALIHVRLTVDQALRNDAEVGSARGRRDIDEVRRSHEDRVTGSQHPDRVKKRRTLMDQARSKVAGAIASQGGANSGAIAATLGTAARAARAVGLQSVAGGIGKVAGAAGVAGGVMSLLESTEFLLVAAEKLLGVEADHGTARSFAGAIREARSKAQAIQATAANTVGRIEAQLVLSGVTGGPATVDYDHEAAVAAAFFELEADKQALRSKVTHDANVRAFAAFSDQAIGAANASPGTAQAVAGARAITRDGATMVEAGRESIADAATAAPGGSWLDILTGRRDVLGAIVSPFGF